MKLKQWLALALCSVSMHASADHAELYLSDESAQARYATGADLIGLRHGQLAAEVFINEEDDLLGALALDFTGTPAGVSRWTFSAGPKIYAATLDIIDDYFVAGAVGAKAAYLISSNRRVQLTGQFYYAPKILTSGDAEDLTDFILRIEMDFVERATGFVGYRLLEADLDDGDGEHELDDDIHIGVRLSF